MVERITEIRWREVFLLTAGMMRKADDLVLMMKTKVDGLLAQDDKIQRFMRWVNEKASSVETTYKPAAVRASYFVFTDGIMYEYIFFRSGEKYRFFSRLAVEIDKNLIEEYQVNEIVIDGIISILIDGSSDVDFYHENLCFLIENISASEFQQQIREIQNELPSLREDKEVLSEWVVTDRYLLVEKLRSIMIEHRNLGHNWQFSEVQHKLLKQYYDANKLLVDCLNSDCYISREVRQEIEGTLFLQIKS